MAEYHVQLERRYVIELPAGKTNAEMLEIAKTEFKAIESKFFGVNVKVNGRITTVLSAWLGHALAHICKSVSFFDPKENAYVLTIAH